MVRTDLIKEIEVKIVASRKLTHDEEAQLQRYFEDALPHAFHVTFNYVAEIPRSPTGKFEDFQCNVPVSRSNS